MSDLEAAKIESDKKIDEVQRELDREFYRRAAANEALKILSEISDVRRVMKKTNYGTVTVKVGSSTHGYRSVELSDESIELALNHEDKLMMEEAKLNGVAFGEWA